MSVVARTAGVATIMVSRAVRTPERVSADVRARVEAAVTETGYLPNLAAGTLKSQRTRIVAATTSSPRSGSCATCSDVIEVVSRDST